MAWSRRTLLATAASTALAGCSDEPAPPGPTGSAPERPPDAAYAYTHVRPGGNRRLAAGGAVADATPVEIPVDGRPAWLLASDGGTASHWTVVRGDDTAVTYRVADGAAETLAEHGAAASPPVGYAAGGSVGLLEAPRDIGEGSRPTPLADGLLYVAVDGDVVLWRGDTTARLDVEAPADARPVALRDDRYLVYGRRTDRYRHGALGDGTEPSSLVVVDTAGERIAAETRLDAPLVFEGLAPLVADLDGDGVPEVVTTVADSDNGARLRVHRPDGTTVATGPVYGPGWRHQLCVAPFAPGGRPELAAVRKPHVDRTVEFYRLEGGGLSVVATLSGFASHTYGSRNLDGGLAADLDADGRPELLVPTTDRRTLAAVRRTETGATTAWSLPLDGELETNLTGVALGDGRVAVGAGTADGVRVWQG